MVKKVSKKLVEEATQTEITIKELDNLSLNNEGEEAKEEQSSQSQIAQQKSKKTKRAETMKVKKGFWCPIHKEVEEINHYVCKEQF